MRRCLPCGLFFVQFSGDASLEQWAWRFEGSPAPGGWGGGLAAPPAPPCVGETGQFAGSNPPREADSVAECRSLAPPGQSVEAELAHSIQQRGMDRIRRRVRQWIVAQHQGAETLLPTRQNRLLPRIPG